MAKHKKSPIARRLGQLKSPARRSRGRILQSIAAHPKTRELAVTALIAAASRLVTSDNLAAARRRGGRLVTRARKLVAKAADAASSRIAAFRRAAPRSR